jgi:hypothetical protein
MAGNNLSRLSENVVQSFMDLSRGLDPGILQRDGRLIPSFILLCQQELYRLIRPREGLTKTGSQLIDLAMDRQMSIVHFPFAVSIHKVLAPSTQTPARVQKIWKRRVGTAFIPRSRHFPAGKNLPLLRKLSWLSPFVLLLTLTC